VRALQLDVEKIGYRMIKPEASIYEDVEKKEVEVTNALAILVSIEKGDTENEANELVKETIKFAKQQKLSRIVLYPYAHLSDNLEKPDMALELFKYMRENAAKEFDGEVIYAPFGWNKQLSLNIKGHPLAEQSKMYGQKAAEKNLAVVEKKKRVDLSIVKKSDWSGLPPTDHRTIGEKLDLFSFQEVSPGMVYWHNNGLIIYKELIRYIREKLDENDYLEISTPALANIALWYVSGHIDHYKDNMFMMDSDGEDLGLKPMNCPSTIMIYKSKRWSYKNLPLRLADFDKLYRNEISGALTGLLRVREITQDDAHIFVAENQLEDELVSLLKLVDEFYKKFELRYMAKLSTMPDNHLGSDELWDKAILHLKNALERNSIKYEIKEKEGAFYGPKIDIDVRDSMDREWQCATIQLDYQLPKRFDLTYTGDDGKEYTPVIIHRVIYGSLERFIGVLTEHVKGKFPTWMSPSQVSIIPISDKSSDYASMITKKLREKRIRANFDDSDKTLDYKIRDAKLHEVPYTIIVGAKEMEKNTISIRDREGKQIQNVELKKFMEKLKEEIEERVNGSKIVEQLLPDK